MRRVGLALTTLCLTALTMPAVGCGGTEATGSTTGGGLQEEPAPAALGPANASGSTEATAMVGAAGGTFSLSNGSRLEIPSGTFSEPTEVTLQNGADGEAFGDREYQRALGPMLNILPAMDAGGGRLRVSVPQQPIPSGWTEDDLAFAIEEVADEQRAMDVLGTVTRWQFFPARVENNRFVAEVGGLPGHRVQFGVAR